jgi:site-specific recombinase XerD
MDIIVKQEAAPVIWSESLAFLKNQIAEKTRSDYRAELRLFALWVRKDALSVTPSDIIAWKEELEGRGLSVSTIHKKLTVVRSFYRFLSQTLNIPNPALCVKLPKVTDDSSKAVLSLQEAMRLIASIDTSTTLGKRDRAIVGLLLVNGLRSIEVSRASIKDIHRVDGFTVLRVHGKGGRIADTKLREDVWKAIQDYLATCAEAKPDEPLFLSIGNLAKGRISSRTIQARVRHYMAASGIQKPNLTTHSLRHTCAVLTLSIGGADIVKVQKMLRHQDPKVTMRYLSSLDSLRDHGVDQNPISLA